MVSLKISLDVLKAVYSLVTVLLFSLIIIPPLIIVAPFSTTGRVSFYFGKLWSWLILTSNGVRLRVEGLEHLVKRQSYIFISNHSSNLDSPVVALSVKHVVRFVAKKSLLKIPLFGIASKLAKMIYIDRDDVDGSIRTLDRNIAALKDGISGCFFAEGTRSSDGILGEFKKGGAVLAIKAGLPIVPVTIVGSNRLLAPAAKAIRAGTLSVIIGKPIDVRGCTIDDRDRLTAMTRAVIEGNLLRFAHS